MQYNLHVENINPEFKSKIDTNTDIYAFIDESGDEGFNLSNGYPKWFVVSAIVMTAQTSNLMYKSLDDYRTSKLPKTPNHKLSFKDLKSHNRRKDILGVLNKYDYQTVHSAFYKPEIDPNDRLVVYPSMYFIGIMNLIERLSWLTKQFNKRYVHILISNRNSISKESLKSWLFVNSVHTKANNSYLNKIGFVGLSTPNNTPSMLYADYTASSMFQCLEKTGTAHIAEEVYFKIFLQKKLYSSNHTKYGGIWSNGFKCTPAKKTLIEYSGILEEGAHKL